MANRLVMLLVSLLSYLLFDGSAAVTFSSKLIHRFSDEAKERWISRGGNASVAGMWPKKESVEFMDLLLLNDLKRQKMRVDLQSSNKSQYQLLFPSQGSHTLYFGNQFYWSVKLVTLCLVPEKTKDFFLFVFLSTINK